MLNSISIIGRLVRNPELKDVNGTDLCRFVVACERNRTSQGERLTDYFDCVAWNKTAEFVSKYFRKGDWIAVTGSMESRTYENKEGNKVRVWEIQTSNVSFCGGRSSKEPEEGNPFEQESEDFGLPF